MPLDKVDELKSSFKTSSISKEYQKSGRPPISTTLGCHLDEHACPRPQLTDSAFLAMGLQKRIGVKLPDTNEKLLNELLTFTEEFCRTHLKPLAPDVDLTKENWIHGLNEPTSVKDAYYELVDTDLKKQHRKVKLFMKDESYTSYKYPRNIMAPHPRFKLEMGPVSKAIEEEIFKLPWFIKHVPANERVEFLSRLQRENHYYYETDYSSFESSFTKRIKQIELTMVKYMVQHLPDSNEIYTNFERMSAINRMSHKHFTAQVESCRMSGEMTTSSHNGFVNLVVAAFIMQESGVSYLEVPMVFEGDDGLFGLEHDVRLKTDLYTQLGFKIKLQKYNSIGEASFCGQVFDSDSRSIITDPRKVLAKFGWTSRNYVHASHKTKKSLLRAKAMSYLAQYPNCPVVSHLAWAHCKLTSGYSIRKVINTKNLDSYSREKLSSTIACYDSNKDFFKKIPEIDVKTRKHMEKVFNFPIEEQLAYERYFLNLNSIQPIPLLTHFDPIWREYFDRYVQEVDLNSDLCDDPITPQRIHSVDIPLRLFWRDGAYVW